VPKQRSRIIARALGAMSEVQPCARQSARAALEQRLHRRVDRAAV
jgi:hypothetical protein